MADWNLVGTPLKVLAKYTKKCLEATVDPFLWNWRARKRGEAELTTTESEIDAFNAMADAQTESAASFLDRIPDTAETIEWKSEITNNLVGSQVQKRIDNQVSIVRGAADILENTVIEDHEPDPDWTAHYSQYAQDVSSVDLQSWWSKILAGEIQNPGQTSLRTLSVLKDLSPLDATKFEQFADCVFGGDSVFYSSASNSMYFNHHLQYLDVIHMQECGLVNWQSTSASFFDFDENAEIALRYHSGFLILKDKDNRHDQLSVPAAQLTTAGRELYQVTNPKPQLQYLEDLSTYLHHMKCQLFSVHNPQIQPNGKISYDDKLLIDPRPILPGMLAT